METTRRWLMAVNSQLKARGWARVQRRDSSDGAPKCVPQSLENSHVDVLFRIRLDVGDERIELTQQAVRVVVQRRVGEELADSAISVLRERDQFPNFRVRRIEV